MHATKIPFKRATEAATLACGQTIAPTKAHKARTVQRYRAYFLYTHSAIQNTITTLKYRLVRSQISLVLFPRILYNPAETRFVE